MYQARTEKAGTDVISRSDTWRARMGGQRMVNVDVVHFSHVGLEGKGGWFTVSHPHTE